MITLGHTKSDNIIRMITIAGCSYLVSGPLKYDHIKRMLILTSDNNKRLSLYMLKKMTEKLTRSVEVRNDDRKLNMFFLPLI